MPAHSGSISGTVAHKHSAPSGDGGDLDEGITNFSGGNLGEVLTATATDTPIWASAASTPSTWTNAGSDVSAVSVSDLTVSGISAADVYQCIFHAGSDDGGNNCRPCVRINGGGSTYNFLYTVFTSSSTAYYQEASQDQYEIGKVSHSMTVVGTFYIYTGNTNLTGFDGTMMRGDSISTNGDLSHLVEYSGKNDSTAAITSIELFFEQDDHTAEDIRGSLQVNTLSY